MSALPDASFTRVLARGRSTVTGRSFNLAVVLDAERHVQWPAVAASTVHHFADYNWDTDRGDPSFVTDKPGTAMKRDPSRLATFKDYVRNIARWLSPN